MTEQPLTEHETKTEPEMVTVTPGRGLSPLLVIFLISGVMGFFAAVVILLSSEEDRGSQSMTVGSPLSQYTPAPMRSLADWEADDFALPSLAGETVSLSDYAGRMVFINFWRTDCAPCVRELPAFKDFMIQQGEAGAVVLAINQGEDPDSVRQFLNDLDINGEADFPVLLDTDLVVGELYPHQFLPTTYVINSEGMVQNFRIGEVTVEELNSYLETDPSAAQG